jgi:hypothetical protein
MDMDYSAARESREASREAMKQKRLNVFIKREEYEDAMNKLPIDEKAIIKDVLNQIKVDNRINRNSKRIEDAFKKDKYESTKIKACLVCIGTIAYIGTALIMR